VLWQPPDALQSTRAAPRVACHAPPRLSEFAHARSCTGGPSPSVTECAAGTVLCVSFQSRSGISHIRITSVIMIHSCQQCERNEDDKCWRHGITSLVLFVSDPLLQRLLAYVSHGILLSLRELTTLLRLRRSSIFILKYTDGRTKKQWVNALFFTHQRHCEVSVKRQAYMLLRKCV
jgi:hypothetical protein